jgi:hypothetical protein
MQLLAQGASHTEPPTPPLLPPPPHYFTGVLASVTWAGKFVNIAIQFRPPANYVALPGVAAVVFDNYTRKVNYSSMHTTELFGFRLDMTNSASVSIPKHLAPRIFRSEINL